MNIEKRNEILREASSLGDYDAVKQLIISGADVNSQHIVNGWTALHWAAKRGHIRILHFLLSHGADPALKTAYSESALSVAATEEVRNILSAVYTDNTSELRNNSPLPITPNYLANPTLAEKVKLQENQNFEFSYSTQNLNQNSEEELVLKVRTSDPPNQDFIEIEIPMKNLTYETVFKICCDELEVEPKNVLKLRKLPNTIVRKDKDVLRFQNCEELELVLATLNTQTTNLIKLPQETIGPANNSGCTSNSDLIKTSNYCKNGRILY